MHLLASSRLAALVLVALAASLGCTKDNPNFCEGECTDAAVDTPIDTPPIVGCEENPNVCTGTASTCVNDVCSDCDYAMDMDEQSADCAAAAPICRTGNACGACTDHEECDSGVCFNGTCATGVLYVDDTGDNDFPVGSPPNDNNCLSPGSPCATVTHALTHVPAINGMPETNRRFIRLQTPGVYSEPSEVDIDDKAVWLIGPSVTLPGVTGRAVLDRGSADRPTLTVRGASDARIERIGINNGGNNSSAHGVVCTSSTLVARGIEIHNHTGHGLLATDCLLTLSGSTISSNEMGGLQLGGAARAVVVNNIVVGNGSNNSPYGGISFGNQLLSTSVLQSNTIVDNDSMTGQTDGIKCDVAGVTARNNIVYKDSPRPRVSGTCSFANTLYGPTENGTILGLLNGNMPVASDALFLFRDTGNRDYRLQTGGTPSVAKDKGSSTGLAPEAGIDIEGEMRPQGTADVGCDEIP